MLPSALPTHKSVIDVVCSRLVERCVIDQMDILNQLAEVKRECAIGSFDERLKEKCLDYETGEMSFE
jgi:hypothetical protein